MTSRTLQAIALASLISAACAGPAAAQAAHEQHSTVPASVPSAIRAEHTKIHQDLAEAVNAGGKTGEAAKKVEAVLTPHFHSEEEFALPPLALLQPLSTGQVPPNSRQMLTLTDRLTSEMPRMLSEHKALLPLLDDLERAAREEHKPEAGMFAAELRAHAQMEEQVLYPAAILVGEYLKLKAR
jgi:hypothetical protein